MHKFCLVLIFTIVVFYGTNALRGVSPETPNVKEKHLYEKDEFTCLDGSKTISIGHVNDDFCDCKDGTDEPGTSACNNGQFYCSNVGSVAKEIFSSRVDDGICDCCDGSDEAPNLCENSCLEHGRVFRQQLIKELEVQKKGLDRRRELVTQGAPVLSELDSRIEKLEAALQQKEEQLNARNEEKKHAKEAAKGQQSVLNKYKKLLKQQRMEKELLNEQDVYEDDQTNHENKDTQDYKKYILENEEEEGEGEGEGEIEEEGEEEGTVSSDDDNDDDDDDYNEDDYDVDSLPTDVRRAHDLLQVRKAADSAWKDVRDQKRNAEKELKDVQKLRDMDFGPDGVYAALRDECFSLHADNYEYKLCMFNEVKQGSTNIGKWEGWADDYATMLFNNGQKCWNGPNRSCKVSLECGETTEILSVAEPNVCEYAMVMTTPAACSEHRLNTIQTLIEPFHLLQDDQPKDNTLKQEVIYF